MSSLLEAAKSARISLGIAWTEKEYGEVRYVEDKILKPAIQATEKRYAECKHQTHFYWPDPSCPGGWNDCKLDYCPKCGKPLERTQSANEETTSTSSPGHICKNGETVFTPQEGCPECDEEGKK